MFEKSDGLISTPITFLAITKFKCWNFENIWRKLGIVLFSGSVRGVVEYQNTRNKPSNIQRNKLKLVLNTKIKKTTVYFIPKISRKRSKEYKA